jgi:hypothetical protein
MDPAARERLLEAMLAELEERGRDRIALADVLARSRVPAADFGADYAGVDDYLAAVHAEIAAELDRRIREGCRTAGDGLPDGADEWPAQVWGGLTALLAELARRPARDQAFVESFGPRLAAGRRAAGAEQQLPTEVERLAIGAAEAIIFEEIASGRAEGLPAMGPSILFSLLVPFVGPTRAAAEMEKVRPRI